MTPEQITSLAKQAGFNSRNGVFRTMQSNGSYVVIDYELKLFAELVRNAALEQALKDTEDLK